MIRHLLFDLDNTLYSAGLGLENNVRRRIFEFTAGYLGVSPEEAEAERQKTLTRYGTSLEWLISEKGLTDIDAYFLAVHPLDEADALPPDPRLRPFLEGLPCPLAILTNSPMEHAERFLSKLGVRDLFVHIFDMRGNGLKGKPRPEVFRRALDALGCGAESVLFIDDDRRHVGGYRAMGGRGVLFDEFGVRSAYPHERIRTLEELTWFL
jgi:putative hydrolase of the HAD superfamily